MHFFFDIFDKEIMNMKNRLLYLVLILALFNSCGKDNDDIVKPEDVSNIDPEKGITFGVISVDCPSNCINIFRSVKNNVFPADTSLATVENPNNYTFFECPIGAPALIVSRAEGIQNIPRGIRDFPSTSLSETIKSTNFPLVYVLEYTLKSGQTKTIQFFNAVNPNRQISEYFSSVISIVDILASNDVDTSPIGCVTP